MAQRWVTEEEYNQLAHKYEEGGSPQQDQQESALMDFYNQLPPELQQKIQILPPEKQQEVLMELLTKYNNSQQNVDNNQQFALGGNTQSVPVEAERNETITTQDGEEPQVEGGYLEQKSYNPVTGQATYEIPDNEHSETHENGGVNMQLSEGDVVNSDKTKIPVDFKVYNKNFKNKTFKEASDYLAKQETKIQDDFATNVKEGKTDKVSDGTLQIMLAKLGKNRDELNELQEQVLESKKQKEVNESLKSGLAEYGKVVLELDKAKEGLNVTLDRYLNYKITEKPVVKAANGLNASIEKFSKFADKVTSNKNASLQDIMSAYKQSGLTSNSKDFYKPTFQPINGSPIIGDFKSQIAQREAGGYKNPYIAVSGISEKDAATHSFNELKSKAASSAIGKYQFIWSIHKNAIKKLTGVSDPDAFRNNPQAQEKYMDWHISHQLTPIATKLKQKYDLPYSINQIMSMIHLEGEAGLEKKIKSGTMNNSTLANNSFKNPSPLGYASHFVQGGKVYAQSGVTVPKLGHAAINQFENTKGNTQGQSMQMGDNYSQSAEPKIIKFITDNIGEDTWNKMPPQLQTQVYSFAFNSKQDDRIFKGLATAINPNEVYKGQSDLDVARQNLDLPKALQMIRGADFSDPTIYNNYIDQILPQQYQSIADNYSGGFDKGQDIYNATWKNRATDIAKIFTDKTYEQNNPFSTWQGDKFTKPPAGYNTVPVNKADYSADDLLTVAKRLSPYAPISSNVQLQELIRDNYKKLTGKDITKIPFSSSNKDLIDGKFGDDWKDAINYFLQNNSSNVDLKATDPKKEDFTIYANNPNKNDLNRNKRNNSPSDVDNSEQRGVVKDLADKSDKTSWMDKLKYGIRESLPYLRNMMLMNEGIINPVLQQKSYQNPYDNFNTDFSIQSALNDADRMTLTAMADERGNPSVRSARLAQIAANAVAAKAPLYTQKYNVENQLQNQKQVGQSQYLNQWEDTNRGLRKDFEHEVLQTREVQRQQKAMAIDNMMNTFLRKQEEDQALKLSLMNTNWDWDKYRQEFVNNPEKAKAQFNYLQAMYKMQGGKDDLSKLAPPGYELEQSYKLVKKKAPTTE